MVLLFCNVDIDGKITESIIGERIIPQKQYDYFFCILKDIEVVIQELPSYQVINRELTLA